MNNRLHIKEQMDFRPWISAVLLLIISFPVWCWNLGANSITIASFLLLAIAYKFFLFNKEAGIIAIIFQLYILAVTHIATTINGYITILTSGLCFATLFLCNAEFLKKCVDCFIKLLAVLLLFALIEHILISFFNFETVSPFSGECPINVGRDYKIYLFNVYLENHFGLFNRFYAFFDEPGVLGNIVMVLLCIQKFDLKKWYNIVFLISGLLSFSLAFYIAAVSYYILFGNKRQKLFFIVVTILGVYYFYYNEFIYDLLFGRMEIVNGSLTGYNRENEDFELWIASKHWSEYFLWGYQPRQNVVYAASWKWAFALYGIVPSLLYLITIIYPRAKYLKNRRDLLIGLMLVVIIWVQRPFIYLYLYVFLLIIPFVYLRPDNVKKVGG